jgi:hypothetical protein
VRGASGVAFSPGFEHVDEAPEGRSITEFERDDVKGHAGDPPRQERRSMRAVDLLADAEEGREEAAGAVDSPDTVEL